MSTLNLDFKLMPKLKFVAYLGSLLAFYRRSARVRGISWALSKEEFQRLTKKPCTYCGKLPKRMTPMVMGERRVSREKLNGVDRVDPSLGYEAGNCVPCCKTCNMAKQGLTRSEFLEHIKKILEFSK